MADTIMLIPGDGVGPEVAVSQLRPVANLCGVAARFPNVALAVVRGNNEDPARA